MASATSFGQPNGNRSGRHKGSLNKQNQLFQAACEEADRRGYPHPYLQMAEWVNDETKPLEVRKDLLKECASYRCPKPKQTVAVETTVPVFQSEDQAEQFLAEFISCSGRLDSCRIRYASMPIQPTVWPCR
jgi:hypothetical protein